MHAIESSLPEDGSFRVSPTYKRYYTQYGEKIVQSFYRQLLDINDLTTRLGLLRIDIDERKINRVYRDFRLGVSGYVFIADWDGYIISSTDTANIGRNISGVAQFQRVFQGGDGYYKYKEKKQEQLVTYHTSLSGNLVFVGIVPFQELTDELRFLERTITVFSIVDSFV